MASIWIGGRLNIKDISALSKLIYKLIKNPNKRFHAFCRIILNLEEQRYKREQNNFEKERKGGSSSIR